MNSIEEPTTPIVRPFLAYLRLFDAMKGSTHQGLAVSVASVPFHQSPRFNRPWLTIVLAPSPDMLIPLFHPSTLPGARQDQES